MNCFISLDVVEALVLGHRDLVALGVMLRAKLAFVQPTDLEIF